jgi:hypothetical protein
MKKCIPMERMKDLRTELYAAAKSFYGEGNFAGMFQLNVLSPNLLGFRHKGPVFSLKNRIYYWVAASNFG